MRRAAFFILGILLAGLMWTWIQGADVPDGTIVSTDYDAGVTAVGAKVLSDLQALEVAVNDIDSSNVSETANIQGSKLLVNSIDYSKIQAGDFDATAVSWLYSENAFEDTILLRLFDHDCFDSAQVDSLFEQGVLQTETGGQKKVAYGDLWLEYPDHGLAAIDLEDTVLTDSSWIQYIDFGDSSAVGDPGFPDAPNSMILGPIYEVGTTAYFKPYFTNGQRDRIASIHYHIVSLAAAGCSVHFHNASSETTAVAGYKIFWEAKE